MTCANIQLVGGNEQLGVSGEGVISETSMPRSGRGYQAADKGCTNITHLRPFLCQASTGRSIVLKCLMSVLLVQSLAIIHFQTHKTTRSSFQLSFIVQLLVTSPLSVSQASEGKGVIFFFQEKKKKPKRGSPKISASI